LKEEKKLTTDGTDFTDARNVREIRAVRNRFAMVLFLSNLREVWNLKIRVGTALCERFAYFS
jgi:hypothetical protein